MFTPNDLEQIVERGSDLPEIKNQISHFKKGFPFLKTVETAGIGNGIVCLTESECDKLVSFYEEMLAKGILPLQVRSRFGSSQPNVPVTFSFQEEALTNKEAVSLLENQKQKSVKQFYERLADFAFYPALMKIIGTLAFPCGTFKHLEILKAVLSPEGLNYGSLPKGLLDFHDYSGVSRTPAEEHLVEGALYGTDSNGVVRIHFTVSPEHLSLFKRSAGRLLPCLKKDMR